MRQFGQRVDLVHELRKLAASEKVADHCRKRLGIDQLLRSHRFKALIEQRHALFDETLGARQTDAALIGEQFAHGSHTAAAEMIDVVQRPLAFFQTEQIFRGDHQIFFGQNARIAVVLDTKLLADLVTAHAAQIVPLRIEEQALDQRPGVRGGRRIARTQAAINIL